jgi:hypothetical protein
MARKRVKVHKPTDTGKIRLYTLNVSLMSGRIMKSFAKKNPRLSRTIKIRDDQTLEDLHHAIFAAFCRWDEHMYEFQFGKGPMDPNGPRYTLPSELNMEMDSTNPPAGAVDTATLDSLQLEIGRSFGYWFDFGDDWWHHINVEAIDDTVPIGKFPRVTKRIGKSPPQYAG